MIVKLQTIVDALYDTDDENVLYLDKEVGETVLIQDGIVYGAEDVSPDEVEDGGRFIALPSSFDINNWMIMQKFIWNLDDEALRNRLNDAIHRSGAFSRFRDIVDDAGITDDWYAFRDDSYRSIAIEWCEDNDIDWKV